MTLDYLYESKKVHKLIAAMRKKLPKQCFVNYFEINGLTEVSPWNEFRSLGIKSDHISELASLEIASLGVGRS